VGNFLLKGVCSTELDACKWMDDIKVDVKETDFDGVDWTQLTSDLDPEVRSCELTPCRLVNR
jgi:hypothetical protein